MEPKEVELETGTLTSNALASDLIFGAEKIAKALGLTRRQVYHAAASGYIPSFRIGATICARRSTLLSWIEDQETVGRNTHAAAGFAHGH